MSSSNLPSPASLPDVDRGYQLVVIQWVFVSIAFLLVILRVGVRGFVRKKIGWDDYLILLAQVTYTSRNRARNISINRASGVCIRSGSP